MNILKAAFALLAIGAAQAHAETLPPSYQQMAALRVFNPASPAQIGGGAHAFGPVGNVTFGASINPDGWSAVVNIPSVAAGGTYALNPSSATPGLVFNVTRQCYNSSQVLTTCAFTVYGTAPKRYPYPAYLYNQELPLIGGIQTTIVLSDDILPSDTVTVTAAAGFYTDLTSNANAAVSGLAVSNGASAATMGAYNSPAGSNGEFFPTGAWVTPSSQRWANGGSFAVEFAAFSKFPRNNGQVSAVKFTASDGTNSVSHVATSMAVSANQLKTTCTATSGSPILTSCASVAHFFTGEKITVAPATVTSTAMNLGSEPSISTISGSSITLSANAGATDTVTVYLGNPIYDYAASFTSTDQAALNAGPITIEAIVYPNLGALTLDTAHAFGGSQTTTCTMNVGNVASPVLTSCGSVAGFNVLDHVAVTGTADAYILNNDLYLWAAPSGATLTLNVTPTTATQATVTVAAGTPANAITPSLKNLTVYNDKGSAYGSACAWVDGTGGASPAVQTGAGCATDPGSTAHYASIYAAASALQTYNNSHYSHNNACGSTIYATAALNGSGGAVSSYIPTACPTPTIIQGASGGTISAPVTITAAVASPDYGYSTMVKDAVFTDTATYKIAFQGPDAVTVSGNGTIPRKGHLIFQNVETLEALSSGCSSFFYREGLVEYYGSYANESVCNDYMMQQYSSSESFTSFGSYVAGASTFSIATINTSLGNLYSNTELAPISLAQNAYSLIPSSITSAFDKVMNYSGSSIMFNFTQGVIGSYPYIRNNLTVAQDAFECTGTISTNTCVSIGADEDRYPHWNLLMEYATVIGNRLNYNYGSIGGYSIPKSSNMLFSAPYDYNTKSDFFHEPLDYVITSASSAYTVSGATGCTGTVDTLTFPAPTSDPTSVANGATVGGVLQTGTVTISGGTIASSGAVSLGTYAVDNISVPVGTGYASSALVATVGDAGCPSATITYPTGSLSLLGYNRTGNWRTRYGVGDVGNVAGRTANNDVGVNYSSWYGDFFGLTGNTTNTTGLAAMSQSFLNNASNSSTDGGGSNTGFGWYKPSSGNTGMKNRVPSGFAGFPGDIEGTPRKNDGTGCAGAYEC